MDTAKGKWDGRRFGCLLIGVLTTVWAAGGLMWLHSLFVSDTVYHRLSVLLPGVLPSIAWPLTFTLLVLWGTLIWLQLQYRNPTVPQLSSAELLDLAPEQFEKHVALIFRRKGYRVKHRGGAGDHGVDLEIITKSRKLGVVQCKRYRSTVGEVVVRDLYGTMLHEGAEHAFLVTAGKISSSARNWVQGKPITLVDGRRLAELAKELSR